MPNVCILTDSTVQFTQSNFPGHERVYIIMFDIQDAARQEGSGLPCSLLNKKKLISPSQNEFIQYYARLSRVYDSILVLTLSSFFNSTMRHALSASDQFSNGAGIKVIDSQTTAIGLGMLVQIAARAATEGASLQEIERRLRVNIPCVYMLFCIPELIYLACSGHIDYSQALVAEMMGMLPIFSVEEGRLVSMEKVRTPRHLFEAFQDFLGEFETPSHIALVSNSIRGRRRATPLRQFVKDIFPEALFTEHLVQPHLATLLGPSSIGLFVMEPMK